MSEQKGANTSRSISAFIDATRRRAIAEGRPMGVLVERLTRDDGPLSPDRGASLRVRQLVGVPSYAGESSNSFAELKADSNWPAVGHVTRPNTGDPDPDPLKIDTAVFNASDNQLLFLSARMIANSELNPPVAINDPIEFPGGRIARIGRLIAFVDGGVDRVKVNFDLEDSAAFNSSTGQSTDRFPATNHIVKRPARSAGVVVIDSNGFVVDLANAGPDGAIGTADDVVQKTTYKIHRRPARSTTAPLDLPRGLAIDLNYSGMGAFGNQFAPVPSAATPGLSIFNNHISITFSADGRVSQVNNAAGVSLKPSGLIFLCLGTTDGLRSDSLLSNDERAPANLMDLQSIWIVINPSTGRVVSSPFASVAPSTATITDPADAALAPAINQARFFAFLSDTVDDK
ncbi:hypothetical protein [Stieleria marina]|uniref:hypothetical protein n=1 Tax=Stieleria marina TaxID=1930275 RepID=UPI003AF3442C